MSRSIPSRRVARKGSKLAPVQSRRSRSNNPLPASGRSRYPSDGLIGLPLAITFPNLKNVRWSYCHRSDEQLAAHLGKSLMRLGICHASDWTGSAVDFVTRGFNRFCRENGSDDAMKLWEGELRLTDCQFESCAYPGSNEREPETRTDALYIIGEFNSSASIPIGPTLAQLEREHRALPKMFYQVFTANLWKWMRVYDYRDAVEQANNYMDGCEEEELKDSFYPQVEKKIPQCLRANSTPGEEEAASFLAEIQLAVRDSRLRNLVHELLRMNHIGAGFEHCWTGKLVGQVPGLEEYLSDCDGCCPGCAITWMEDDEISACFDEEANNSGQNGPLEPSTMLVIPLSLAATELDQRMRSVLEYVSGMLKSLASAAKIVEMIREINDEYLRDHRLKPGVPSDPGLACVRKE